MADTSKPSRARTPSASAAAPETKPAVDDSFPLSRWQESPAVHGIDPHVLAGAAALAGWKPTTKLTKKELQDGVREFRNHKPTEEGP